MSPFRGSNQAAGRVGGATPKGPIPQKRLVQLLRVLIDTAQEKSASKTRDDARATVRLLMATANWNTPYVTRNIGARRCRYLLGLGYPVDYKPAFRSSVERLTKWGDEHG
jgi:hypothetical protein